MKTCPQCRAVNPPEANFCTSCRALLNPQPAHAYCEKGHAIDPSWAECYQCKMEQQMADRGGAVVAPVRAPTVFESPNPPASPRLTSVEEPPRVHAPEPRPAVPTPPMPVNTARRVTLFDSSSVSSPGSPAAERQSGPAVAGPLVDKKPVRRIVGVLITYTWRPEGQIFPVREGRNLIGRNPEKCEIALPEDAHLSEINSHITFRRNFTLGDMVSMSGTDLNGAPVEDNFVRLPNYSEIRTGSTRWTFIMAEAGEANSDSGPPPAADA